LTDAAEAKLLGRRDAAAAGALLLFPLAAYAPVLSQWWTGDDTQILRHALSHSLREVLTVPAAWRDLTWLYFTPELTVAARLDEALFGLHPGGWYAHHLLVLGAAAALLYVLVRRAAGRLTAFLAALLLLLGPPTAEISRQLWSRHYVAGLAFSLAALLLHRIAVARRSWAPAAAAGCAALLAMLCKEIYAPLPAVALAWPGGDRRDRARFAIPLFVALAVYLPWRQAMVGWWGGVRDAGEPLRRAVAAAASFPGGIAGLPLIAGVVLIVLALFLLRPTLEEAVAIAVIAAAIVGPLALLPDVPTGRYAFLPLAAAAALAGAAAGRGVRDGGVRRALAAALLLGLLVPAAVKSRASFSAATPRLARSRAEGQFDFELSTPADVLLAPVEPGWFFYGMRDLRAREGRGPAGAVVYDAFALCGQPPPGRLVAFDAAAGAVTEVTGARREELDRACARLDPAMPLSVRMTYRDWLLRWVLGPDRSGTWALLNGDTAEPFPVASEGSFVVRLTPPVNLRVKREAPDGRVGLSPPFTLHVRDGAAEASFDFGARRSP
jgi:hypothetical protein